MFRHMMKLIWKRKSRNLMLSLEILIAFVIVFATPPSAPASTSCTTCRPASSTRTSGRCA